MKFVIDVMYVCKLFAAIVQTLSSVLMLTDGLHISYKGGRQLNFLLLEVTFNHTNDRVETSIYLPLITNKREIELFL